MSLPILWFLIMGVLLAGYAILDGFDLGVGMLHLVAQGDTERRTILNSIGPIWDGNEVWLITFGGAMFAAFPDVYATVFSGYYMALMLVLLALIFRAVSLEFRSKLRASGWRTFWDWGFFLSSLLAALLFGVAVGSAMSGIPLNDRGIFVGTFFTLLTPYSVMVGLCTVALFAMHGSIYLYLKTEGPLQQRVHGWMWHTFGLFMVTYILTTIMTLVTVPRAIANFKDWPWAWLIVLLNVLAIANIPRSIFLRKPGQAFASSCLTVAALVSLLGMGLFPNLVVTSNPAGIDLNIWNAASSPKTLFIMTLIALVGMPFVLAYTAVVYWTFRGKVQLTDHSY